MRVRPKAGRLIVNSAGDAQFLLILCSAACAATLLAGMGFGVAAAGVSAGDFARWPSDGVSL